MFFLEFFLWFGFGEFSKNLQLIPNIQIFLYLENSFDLSVKGKNFFYDVSFVFK